MKKRIVIVVVAIGIFNNGMATERRQGGKESSLLELWNTTYTPFSQGEKLYRYVAAVVERNDLGVMEKLLQEREQLIKQAGYEEYEDNSFLNLVMAYLPREAFYRAKSKEMAQLIVDKYWFKTFPVGTVFCNGRNVLFEEGLGAATLQFLVDNGEEVNQTDIYGLTPLLALLHSRGYSRYDLAARVEVLLKKGADVTQRDRSGKGPLQLVYSHEKETKIVLLAYGAERQ